MSHRSVLVLGGGPDAEREVSVNSARGVAEGLRAGGTHEVIERTIERITLEELRTLPGDCVFPVLHGAFGEGGPLQDLMERDGRPYVGCGPVAARLAMDKLATKLLAARAGIPTAEACVFNPGDAGCPLPLPVVLKPVHDGSSVGLHIVRDSAAWVRASESARVDMRERPGRSYLVERFIAGTELTCPVIDGQAMPIINIRPKGGVYDFEAKYRRSDTQYVVNPDLPPGVAEEVKQHAVRLFRTLGCRHLSRVDFLLDGQGRVWMLEINTMPGFTASSLVPKSAASAGIDMPRLCERLVGMALRDAGAGEDAAARKPT